MPWSRRWHDAAHVLGLEPRLALGARARLPEEEGLELVLAPQLLLGEALLRLGRLRGGPRAGRALRAAQRRLHVLAQAALGRGRRVALSWF